MENPRHPREIPYRVYLYPRNNRHDCSYHHLPGLQTHNCTPNSHIGCIYTLWSLSSGRIIELLGRRIPIAGITYNGVVWIEAAQCEIRFGRRCGNGVGEGGGKDGKEGLEEVSGARERTALSRTEYKEQLNLHVRVIELGRAFVANMILLIIEGTVAAVLRRMMD